MISLPHKHWYRYFPDGQLPEMWEWVEDKGEWTPSQQHRNCNKTMTDQGIITIVTARLAGKRIEKRRKFQGEQPWVLDDLECWNFLEYDYRMVIPPRPVWLKGGFHEGKIRWIECEKDEPGAVQFVEVKP